MTAATERKAKVRHIKSEASTAKRSLMDLQSQLVRIGANTDARRLDAIIGRIEAWQNA